MFSCDSQNSNGGQVYVNQPAQSNVYVTPKASNLGDNFDLQALGELVKKAKSAQDLENQLNTTGSINNLDLDGDGKVDYIKVTEYGDANTKGFSFTVDMANGEKQEVATVEIQKDQSGNNQQATMNINGNQQIYGNNNYYSGNYLMTDLLIWHYLFYPHPYYVSPWHYGYYPGYYRPYGCLSSGYYRTRVGSVTRTSTIRTTTRTTTTKSSVKSPNSSMSSKSVQTRSASLSNPTRSQKSFSTTSSSNSRPSTSGFGNKSSSSGKSSSSSSFGRSSSSSSSRSSSSGRSFGSSSHSSGGGGRRSDVRFKTNIAPLTNSLDKICALQGVNYDWKIKEFPAEKFDTTKQIGFIAQDIEKVYPMLVNTRPDGYKTVDYQMLVPALVEAVKQMQAEIVKQDSTIKYLYRPVLTTSK